MSGVDAVNSYFHSRPTYSYINEEGKNVILPQSKEEPYSFIIPGGWAGFFWRQVRPPQ